MPRSSQVAICSRDAPRANAPSFQRFLSDFTSTFASDLSGRTSAAATMKPVVGSAAYSAMSIRDSRGAFSAWDEDRVEHLVVDLARKLLGGDDAVALEVIGGLGVVEIVEQPGEPPAVDVLGAEPLVLGERAHDELGGDAVVDEVRVRDALAARAQAPRSRVITCIPLVVSEVQPW